MLARRRLSVAAAVLTSVLIGGSALAAPAHKVQVGALGDCDGLEVSLAWERLPGWTQAVGVKIFFDGGATETATEHGVQRTGDRLIGFGPVDGFNGVVEAFAQDAVGIKFTVSKHVGWDCIR